MTVNQVVLKLVLAVLTSFSHSVYAYIMLTVPSTMVFLPWIFLTHTILLVYVLIFLFGGFKKLNGWWKRKMMAAHQKATQKKAIKAEVKARLNALKV